MSNEVPDPRMSPDLSPIEARLWARVARLERELQARAHYDRFGTIIQETIEGENDKVSTWPIQQRLEWFARNVIEASWEGVVPPEDIQSWALAALLIEEAVMGEVTDPTRIINGECLRKGDTYYRMTFSLPVNVASNDPPSDDS